MFKIFKNINKKIDHFNNTFNIKFNSNITKNSMGNISIIQPDLNIKKVESQLVIIGDEKKQEHELCLFWAKYIRSTISTKNEAYNKIINNKFENLFDKSEFENYNLILKSYKDMMMHPVLYMEDDKHIDIIVRTRQSASYSYCDNENKLKLATPLKLNENYKYYASPMAYRYIKQNNESLDNIDLLFPAKKFKFTKKYESQDEFIKLWGDYFKDLKNNIKNDDYILINKYINKGYSMLNYMLEDAYFKYLKGEISRETFESFKEWVESQEGVKIDTEEIIKLYKFNG